MTNSPRNLPRMPQPTTRLLETTDHMAQRYNKQVFRRTVTVIFSPGWKTISSAGSVNMYGKFVRLICSDTGSCTHLFRANTILWLAIGNKIVTCSIGRQ
ncbi:hypothetical protein PoB_003772600 [Plakobranchus ocellatus]|uniref:Uncharacterized protein n=1 Tax=Plakobranchus ocellatus TaxID=259542 RepID=A0AAV4AXG3_9GAST|nr:hypothetical protein PoB_003772600 [Plakobranchus ocellatus]